MKTQWIMGMALLGGLGVLPAAAAAPARIVDAQVQSRVLAGNRVGVDTLRRIKVYLPSNYDRSDRRYPVVYYIHNANWSATRLFEENQLHGFVERAVERGQLGEVILVAGDFTTPQGYNLFGNDPVAGRWMDHIGHELVPFVDANYRTRATAASRAIVGDFFGGYAAIKAAMFHPDKFGVMYALHPVGTGTGLQPGFWRPDWRLIHEAQNWEDLRRDVYAPIFVSMAQAYLPNPSRPPFFCDFMVEVQDGQLQSVTANIVALQSRFLLDALLKQHADDLKRLRAIKIDWGRYDELPGHVYANQAFTRKLEELGVMHHAEEYSGNAWNRLWVPHGRVEGDLLPFIADFLEGAAPQRSR